MYSNFINHYYLSNVHHAAAIAQTRQHLTKVFLGKNDSTDSSDESEIENATLVELDRVWLRRLSTTVKTKDDLK